MLRRVRGFWNLNICAEMEGQSFLMDTVDQRSPEINCRTENKRGRKKTQAKSVESKKLKSTSSETSSGSEGAPGKRNPSQGVWSLNASGEFAEQSIKIVENNSADTEVSPRDRNINQTSAKMKKTKSAIFDTTSSASSTSAKRTLSKGIWNLDTCGELEEESLPMETLDKCSSENRRGRNRNKRRGMEKKKKGKTTSAVATEKRQEQRLEPKEQRKDQIDLPRKTRLEEVVDRESRIKELTRELQQHSLTDEEMRALMVDIVEPLDLTKTQQGTINIDNK